MRVQTDTYNVYEFDELSKEVQEIVLQRERENMEYPFLQDELLEVLESELRDNKITFNEFPDVYFSLSYSQGDGVMFEGTVYWKSYTAVIKHSGFYYHYNSKDIDLFSTKTDKQASEKTYQEFNDIYVNICGELEKSGYNYIELVNSNESIIEMIDANEYEFTENGKMI